MPDFEDIISYPEFSWTDVNFILEESSLDTLIWALKNSKISKLVDVQHYLKKHQIDFARLFRLTNSFKILKKFIDYYARQNNLEFYSCPLQDLEIQEYRDERYSYQQKRNLKIQNQENFHGLLRFTTIEKLKAFVDSNQDIDEFLGENKSALIGSLYTYPRNNTDPSCESGQYSVKHGGEKYYTFGCVANEKSKLSPIKNRKNSKFVDSHDCVYYVVKREKIIELFKKKINIDKCLSGKMDRQARQIFTYLCFFTGYEQTRIDNYVYCENHCFNGFPHVNNISLDNTFLFEYFFRNCQGFFEISNGVAAGGGFGYW